MSVEVGRGDKIQAAVLAFHLFLLSRLSYVALEKNSVCRSKEVSTIAIARKGRDPRCRTTAPYLRSITYLPSVLHVTFSKSLNRSSASHVPGGVCIEVVGPSRERGLIWLIRLKEGGDLMTRREVDWGRRERRREGKRVNKCLSRDWGQS
jgi:hypothetical protein